MSEEIVWIDVNERSRTYVFVSDGRFIRYTVEGVVRLAKRDNSHRLELKGGGKTIVAPGWAFIEIDVDNWSA